MAYIEVKKKAGGGFRPNLLYAGSINKYAGGTLSYTIPANGKYQIYGFESGDSNGASYMLNGTPIAMQSYTHSNATFYYAEITASANDVITATNSSQELNYGMHLFVFEGADISSWEFIGAWSNDNLSHDIDHAGDFILEAVQCSYYGIRNTFGYTTHIGFPGLKSIMIPNSDPYYYGVGYAIVLG